MSSPPTCERGGAGGPLSGIRIVDLTTALSGPLATHFLALLGADVIKVEPPNGDIGRIMGRRGAVAGMSALHLQTNQGKRSIAVDLRAQAGREVLLRLVDGADALVHNMRAAAARRLAITPTDLQRRNPRLVIMEISGFAASDERASRPVYDDVVQGATGLPWLVGAANGGTPGYVPLPLADRLTGTLAFGYLSAALLARERDGKGRTVTLPMFEALAHLVLSDHLQDRTTDASAVERGHPRLLGRHRRPVRLRDGHVCLQPTTDAQWRALLGLSGRQDRLEDARLQDMPGRLAHADLLDDVLRSALAGREVVPFLAACAAADIPASAMVDIDTLSRDPAVENGRLLRRVDRPAGAQVLLSLPGQWSDALPGPKPAPELSQDARPILRDLGFGEHEIERLVEQSVVGVADGREAA